MHEVSIRIGEVELDARIAFADSNEVPRVLGRSGIFKRFRITFDEDNLRTIFEAP